MSQNLEKWLFWRFAAKLLSHAEYFQGAFKLALNLEKVIVLAPDLSKLLSVEQLLMENSLSIRVSEFVLNSSRFSAVA